jgi:hypothetical protein
MSSAYDRKELVARFEPGHHCRPIDGAKAEVPIKSSNRSDAIGATYGSSDKPPQAGWFDERRRGGFPIKPSDFNRLDDRQTTQTTQTTKFKQSDQRSAIVDFPNEWQAISDKLKGAPRVDGFGDARWQALVDDTEAFLARWGEAAHVLGWTAIDLFGVHPAAPAVRFDVMGLLPLLGGASVVALTRDEARMRRPSRAILTFRKVAQAGAVLITMCLQ